MVKTLHFHYREHGSIPDQGIKIPQAMQCGQKFFLDKIKQDLKNKINIHDHMLIKVNN